MSRVTATEGTRDVRHRVIGVSPARTQRSFLLSHISIDIRIYSV